MANSTLITAVVQRVGRLSTVMAPRERGEGDDAELGIGNHSRRLKRMNSGNEARGQPTTSSVAVPLYGSTTSLSSSPERIRQNNSSTLLICVPEDGAMDFNGRESVLQTDVALEEDEDSGEEELALEEELAEHGLYRALYTFTPFTSILTLILLAFLPSLAFTSNPSTPRYSYVPYLPFPLPEIIVSTALWSLSHILRDAFFLFAALLATPFGSYAPPFTTILSTIFQTVFSVFLQQISIPLLLITLSPAFSHPTWEDPAFRRVWWVALGWAAAEGIAGIKQGYEAIALYRDVLVIARRVDDSSGVPRNEQNARISEITGLPSSSEQQYRIGLDTLALEENQGERRPLLPRNGTGKYPSSDELRLEVERDLDQLIAIRNREELEEVYGMPMIISPTHFKFNTHRQFQNDLAQNQPAHHHHLDLRHPRSSFLIVPAHYLGLATYWGTYVCVRIFFLGLGVWEALI
ncbi:hypothetical protein K443DRAFT_82511 [Laccaria amethystina LaAM-08-1]|uniref:Uncharacterized protein n=1 Tax=Laccaria amethystina LaAM-08-1 TaxID=1095629 RepID=A0A0C9YNP1_9AGAR|nr:hypothetical protein K443DRAFT_82511 [Laccaria amethystina LaAM-08-1]